MGPRGGQLRSQCLPGPHPGHRTFRLRDPEGPGMRGDQQGKEPQGVGAARSPPACLPGPLRAVQSGLPFTK